LRVVHHIAGAIRRRTEHGAEFTEVSMQHRGSTPVMERAALPIASAPVAERLEAPLLAIMFHLLGGSDRWRALPILRLWTRRSPSIV
jgi:hypothetical protein